jgi:hypothetical protein
LKFATSWPLSVRCHRYAGLHFFVGGTINAGKKSNQLLMQGADALFDTRCRRSRRVTMALRWWLAVVRQAMPTK